VIGGLQTHETWIEPCPKWKIKRWMTWWWLLKGVTRFGYLMLEEPTVVGVWNEHSRFLATTTS